MVCKGNKCNVCIIADFKDSLNFSFTQTLRNTGCKYTSFLLYPLCEMQYAIFENIIFEVFSTMRIVIFLLLMCGFIIEHAFSQHRLKGFLGVEGGESFAYVMEFKDSSGFIKGYSYTYQTEKKEVKAQIEGLLDRENHILRFRETGLLYNHGFESRATICLIQTELKFVKEDGRAVFKGQITTSDATHVTCSGGTIVMNDETAINDLFEASFGTENKNDHPADKTPKTGKPVKYVYDTATKVQKITRASEKMQQVTEGKDVVLYWDSDSIVIYLWDGGKIDGDVLSIWVGDRNLINRYTLTKEKKRLSMLFSGKEMIITVQAENEGNEPPNTANMLLEDNKVRHSVFAYNVMGKVAKIRIVRK